ncbi:MAG TPA: adenylate/guanylate cyclase domain-containing protein [Gaiella sp.]|uniref:adenylate/guanylate cyclase domain-containing protein n=1 Tax=Gaiella sp. TaxID=2663207 RepID=UPI002D7F6FFC|nr:adenylate/guanylate cyclase domain-containing protein [Gaiella sp.]HET9288766.1 adenylate/guanylate cyclase domain-containing protein [Gaiella sp.]
MSSSDDELRPVTVLFADVVGSTALAERLPPDEAKALIGECVNQMSRAVHEYGGTVQAYMGDGICAYFGVPVAREDDPERAARTALRILEVVRDYARDVERAWGIEEFDVRVGINAGPAAVGVVGDVEEQTVAFGDTTNVAARLQSLAAPGTIVVGEEAARRLAHRFELEPIGRLAVKGRSKEVEVQQLVQPLQRDQARPRQHLVGRTAEAERLSTIARELASGRGQVLLVVGDAGIGKTRLVEELHTMLGEEAAWLEGHCLSYGGLPTWPFEEMLRRWLGIADEEPEIATRTRVRARLGALLGPRLDDALAPLGRLLRVRLDPDRSPVAAREDPPEAIHEALHAWIEALARTRPVVVVLEDLHWALPDAREAAESLLDLTDRAAVLLVATLRADPGSEAWRFRLRALGDFAHRTSELRLDPLTDAEATQLVRTLAAGSIDEETIASAVARAEGNPLFLEELVRLLLEGSAVQRRRTWTLTVGQTELPARLENLLVARVDALPDAARRLAQIAAVIGRTFEVPLLERVAGTDDSAADMLALVRGDIVRELRRYPDLVCEFRHGLLHEAALSTLTPPRQRELAGRIGVALEELLGARAGDEAERLAHYYVRSDRLDKAVAYLERAADDAGDSARREELLEAARKAAARQGDVDAERRFEARLAELPSRPGGQLT